MAKNSVGASLGQAMPSPDKLDPDSTPSEWETKDHMNTIIGAHEIINNPVKMKAVHALAGRHNKAIKSIQDIKNYNQDTYGPKAKKPGVGNLVGKTDPLGDPESESDDQ